MNAIVLAGGGPDAVSATAPGLPNKAFVEIGGIEESLTPAGDLRTLPCGLADPDPRMAGLDGFFAARLERVAFSDGKPA